MYTLENYSMPLKTALMFGCIAVSDDGKYLAIVSAWDYKVTLFELDEYGHVTGEPFAVIDKSVISFWFSSTNNGICFSRKRCHSILICDGYNKRIVEVNIAKDNIELCRTISLQFHSSSICCGNTHIAVTQWENLDTYLSQIQVYDYDSGVALYTITLDSFCFFSGLRVSRDDTKIIASDYNDSTVKVFDLKTGKFVKVLGTKSNGLNRPCDVMEYDDQGTIVVANGYSHNVIIINSSQQTVVTVTCSTNFTYPLSLACIPQKGFIVKESSDAKIKWLRDEWLETVQHNWLRTCI